MSARTGHQAGQQRKKAKKTKKQCALMVHAAYILPVEPQGVLCDHTVCVAADGNIAALLPTARARVEFEAAEEIAFDAPHVLIPGLVNAHTHVGMSLLRGFADDLPLMEWLSGHIWPAEGKFVSPSFVSDSARLSCAEMIKGGTTAFNDMYFYSDSIAAVVAQAGMRAALGVVAFDFPSAVAKTFEEYVEKGLAAREAAIQKEVGEQKQAEEEEAKQPKNVPGNVPAGLITWSMCPHAPYTVGDSHLQKLFALAEEHNGQMHTHLHETAEEVRASCCLDKTSPACHRSTEKLSPVHNFERLGLLSPRLVAAHMTHATEEEIALFAKRGCHVVHCPSSNLKLASGMCPVAAMLRAGVNVAVGTDSCASNNKLDMFAEMRGAALLAKAVAQDATAVNARTALRMATLNGAKAMGLGEVTGSLLPGKSFDCVALDLSGLSMAPLHSARQVESHVVYAADRSQVSEVWVQGRHLLRGGQLLTMDEASILVAAREWGGKLASFAAEQTKAGKEKYVDEAKQ